jgi:hypothetical protein
MAVHMNRWNQLLWGTFSSAGTTGISTTGAPSNEDNTVWDAPHSLVKAIDATTTYGGVDRSLTANAYFRGNKVTAATPADFESLINYANYDAGLSKKGTGIDLMLVGAANFKKAKAEAKSKGGTIILNGGIPQFGEFGFKRELVKIDNTWIVYDPECPATEVAGLNLDTWTVAVHPDANFRATEPTDQSKIDGGDDAQTGVIRTELMVVCEVPSLNIYWTNVS